MKKSSYNIGYILFLAVVAACGGFLFGYDTAVISGTIKQVTTLFGLNDIEQGWYVGCALVGSIAGVAVAGTMSDWIGRRLTMIFASIMFSVSAIGCALCGSYQWLVFYRIVGGIGIGIVSIVSPMYISEIAVTEYRGRLVSLYQLAITVGFLGAYLINYWLLSVSESTRFDSELMKIGYLSMKFGEVCWVWKLCLHFCFSSFCLLYRRVRVGCCCEERSPDRSLFSGRSILGKNG